MKKQLTQQAGYVLTALLVFMVVILLITTTTVLVSISTLQGELFFDSGMRAVIAADSGAENAILRILRDPTYVGETMQIEGTDVVVTVSSGSPQLVTVVADSGSFERTVQVELERVEGMLQVNSWLEQ